jgi:hypothetical protein
MFCSVETLGEAWNFDWSVDIRCLDDEGKRGLKHKQDLNVNQLVLARDDGPWLSWWEAVPADKAGDGIKLRWRNKDQQDAHAAAP